MGIMDFRKVPDVALPTRLQDAQLNATYGPTATPMKAAFSAGADGERYIQFGTPQHEDGTTYTYPTPLNFGAVTPPPAALAPASKGFDIVAHWYNDFGLDSTSLSATEANGWYGWYDWQWNKTTNTGNGTTTMAYSPSRHPIQGFYKGDNADVLGWQCKWLAEAGVNVVSITPTKGHFTTTGWSAATSTNHWVYQLFNNTPNFSALQYMLWLQYDSDEALVADKKLEIEAQNDEIVAAYATYPGAYAFNEDGKTYAVAFTFDLEAIRGVYDNFVGAVETVAYLKALAAKFKTIGYDGVMVMARNGGTVTASNSTLSDLRKSGCLVVEAEYSSRYASDATYSNSYANYAANVAFPTKGIVNVATSADTIYPHPGTFDIPGNTPALFQKVLRRAVSHVIRNKMRRIVTVYNVSEWAEGGAGLLPNKQDGFGYLDAIRSLPVAPTPRSTTSRPGTVLALLTYRPGSDTPFGVTGASFTDVHATNLAITFTAPESGSVLVALSGVSYATTADETIVTYWGLREGGSDVPNTVMLVTKGTTPRRCNVDIQVTGLTPKQSYTYKWAMRANVSAVTVALNQGPNYGASSMKVMAID